jgi:acetyl esterase
VPLDPGVQAMLSLLESLQLPALHEGTPQSARRAMRRLTVDLRQPDAVVAVGDVRDVTIEAPAGPLAARIYRPAGGDGDGADDGGADVDRGAARPTILFLHGGGFVMGDIDTHDNECRWVCREVDAVVVSLDYRRAPDDPFPAAVEDALDGARWVADHLDELGGDPGRFAIAGDSAGGNLAAVVAQAWREEMAAGRPALAAQLLIYPAVDLDDDGADRYPSRLDNADGYLLTSADMRWFGWHYAGQVEDRRDPRLSPILGDLTGLPPAIVVTAEYDPLRDEGEAYATAMADAGVDVELRRFDGLIHGFFDLAALSPACAVAVRETCQLLRKRLAAEPAAVA